MIPQNHQYYQTNPVSRLPSLFVPHTQLKQPNKVANVKQIFHHKHHQYHLTPGDSSFIGHHQRHHHISSSHHLNYQAAPSSSSSSRDKLSSNTLERDLPQLNSDLIDDTFKSTAHHDDSEMMNDAEHVFPLSSSTKSSSIASAISPKQTNLLNHSARESTKSRFDSADGRVTSSPSGEEELRDDETTLLVTRVFNSSVAKASMLSSPLCPSVCQCKWRSGKKTVLCESSSLTSIPDSIESDTQVLNLNDNDLDEFLNKDSASFASLGLTNLQRVYLSR